MEEDQPASRDEADAHSPDTASTGKGISASERDRRKKAVAFAVANAGLSGFNVPLETDPQLQRFIDGDIDLAELLDGNLSVDQLGK
ncbi:chromosome segregation protein ParM [Massilia sp. CCM 8733]|uniref:Chromosome segregation protein ParM n=1 Tax=Massilia mucilaginosa TaxID=2609282 RepID=A0ABX0NSK4_9BURK|nr:antitoxin VbhA family protein [Massilia mucilaginosa]NHZ89827.1 chromosome segregation protein ParM [Massilia mucilaginosa]